MEHAHVCEYDGLRGDLPDDTKKLIASFLMTEEKEIMLEYSNNQVSKLYYAVHAIEQQSIVFYFCWDI